MTTVKKISNSNSIDFDEGELYGLGKAASLVDIFFAELETIGFEIDPIIAEHIRVGIKERINSTARTKRWEVKSPLI